MDLRVRLDQLMVRHNDLLGLVPRDESSQSANQIALGRESDRCFVVAFRDQPLYAGFAPMQVWRLQRGWVPLKFHPHRL